MELFVEDLSNRRERIVEEVKALYPIVDEESLPANVKEKWTQWINQISIIGFNSGKYGLNMVKEFFVKSLADMGDVKVSKKDNFDMFLSTPEFKFLDIKNYLAPGLSFDSWCKANNCKVNKLVFPYEWLHCYDKLSHEGPVRYEDFQSSLNKTITPEE